MYKEGFRYSDLPSLKYESPAGRPQIQNNALRGEKTSNITGQWKAQVSSPEQSKFNSNSPHWARPLAAEPSVDTKKRWNPSCPGKILSVICAVAMRKHYEKHAINLIV